MKTFKMFLENKSKYVFIGDCRTLANGYFDDATEMANVVDEDNTDDVFKISRIEFEERCVVSKPKVLLNCEFWCNKYKDIFWIYDTKKDIHFFYS